MVCYRGKLSGIENNFSPVFVKIFQEPKDWKKQRIFLKFIIHGNGFSFFIKNPGKIQYIILNMISIFISKVWSFIMENFDTSAWKKINLWKLMQNTEEKVSYFIIKLQIRIIFTHNRISQMYEKWERKNPEFPFFFQHSRSTNDFVYEINDPFQNYSRVSTIKTPALSDLLKGVFIMPKNNREGMLFCLINDEIAIRKNYF